MIEDLVLSSFYINKCYKDHKHKNKKSKISTSAYKFLFEDKPSPVESKEAWGNEGSTEDHRGTIKRDVVY